MNEQRRPSDTHEMDRAAIDAALAAGGDEERPTQPRIDAIPCEICDGSGMQVTRGMVDGRETMRASPCPLCTKKEPTT